MSGFVLPVVPKASTVTSHAPTTGQLVLGEIALNQRDGILYASVKLDGTTNTVMALAGTGVYLTPAAAATTYAPITGSANYAPASGSSNYAPITGSTTYAPIANPTFTGTQVLPSADINGGTIDGAVIGASVAAAATHTTLLVSSTVTFSGLTASTLPILNSSKQFVSGTLSNGLTAGSGTLTITPSNILPTVPSVKTAAYTAVQADNNTTIIFNLSTALVITIPSLAAGTSFTVVQRGAGKVTWTGSGATVTAYPTATGTAGVGAQMTFYYDTTTTVLVGGAIS